MTTSVQRPAQLTTEKMPTQKMKVDIAKLALNLDGCRFGSPPAQQRQQRQEEDDPRHQRQCASATKNDDGNHHDNNNDNRQLLSPLSTHHLNHKAQYNHHHSKPHHQHNQHYHNELTSPLGTTYRREGLSIGHNFLRFQGSTLSNNFNSNQLDILECIGRGVCSAVWKARRKQPPRKSSEEEGWSSTQQHNNKDGNEEKEEYYALKVFSMRDPQKRTMLIRELKLLCSTTTTTTTNNNNFADNDEQQGQECCECLVELEGAFLDELDGTVTLVLEYMNFGSLADLLSPSNQQQQQHRSLPEYAIASIAYQMIWGLAYLHHTGVLHRDIKPANVLLSTEGRVKLADFGIVSDKYNNPENDDDDTTTMNVTMVGTTRYMSPERLHGQPYNQQADIWSLGLILLECTRGGGNSPFEHVHSLVELVQTLDDCSDNGGTMGEYIPNGTSVGLRQILMGCLNHCPEKRMPADVLIGSPWFEENGIECVDDAVVGMKRYLETL